MTLCVVIPAWNEEETICEVILQLHSAVPDARVLVVDDASDDRTAQFARAGGAIVLTHALNRGQGAALETGNRAALAQGAEIVVHFDADGQHRAEDIARLVEPIARGSADVVFGSRFLMNHESRIMNQGSTSLFDSPPYQGGDRGGLLTTHYSLLTRSTIPFSKQHILFPIARVVNRLLTGVWLSDAHNGLRALSRRAAKAIEITHDRMAHNSEIVREARRKGLRFCEVPAQCVYREYGQGVRGGFSIVKDFLLKRFVS